MGTTEIVLLLLGAVVFIASFVLPEKKVAGKTDIKLEEAQIREIAEKEMKGIQERFTDTIEDTVSSAVEKAERSMERLANEKIMAVNEYSDTVLKEINRNHEEVVFLYDMLNDKHLNIKNTVKEVEMKAKEVKQTIKDAELTAKDIGAEIQDQKQEAENRAEEISQGLNVAAKETPAKKSPAKKKAPAKAGKQKKVEPAYAAEVSVQFTADSDHMINSNEKILALHKEGRSNMAIAKELGLGIGEVKLVIDLYEGL